MFEFMKQLLLEVQQFSPPLIAQEGLNTMDSSRLRQRDCSLGQLVRKRARGANPDVWLKHLLKSGISRQSEEMDALGKYLFRTLGRSRRRDGESRPL